MIDGPVNVSVIADDRNKQIIKSQMFDKWGMKVKPFIIPRKVLNGFSPFVLIFEVSMDHPKYKNLKEYVYSFIESQELNWKNVDVIDDRKIVDTNLPSRINIEWTGMVEVDCHRALKLITSGFNGVSGPTPNSSQTIPPGLGIDKKGLIVFTEDHSKLPMCFFTLAIGGLTQNDDVNPFFVKMLGSNMRYKFTRPRGDKLYGLVKSITKWTTMSEFC